MNIVAFEYLEMLSENDLKSLCQSVKFDEFIMTREYLRQIKLGMSRRSSLPASASTQPASSPSSATLPGLLSSPATPAPTPPPPPPPRCAVVWEKQVRTEHNIINKFCQILIYIFMDNISTHIYTWNVERIILRFR